jgi:hypothetical protein
MLGWTLGGYPSPNLEVVHEVERYFRKSEYGETDENCAYRVVSSWFLSRFGRELYQYLREASNKFSRAFREFPFHGNVVYSAPQQVGPANLLYEKNTGYRASMVGFPYDDLDGWRAIYPAAVFIAQFEKVADGFRDGLDDLRKLDLTPFTSKQRTDFASFIRVAEASEIHFRSVANQARFVLARQNLTSTNGSEKAALLINELETLLKQEIVLAQRLHALQRIDSRLGFEATNQYYYVPVDLVEKALNCLDLLDRWLPAERVRRKL